MQKHTQWNEETAWWHKSFQNWMSTWKYGTMCYDFGIVLHVETRILTEQWKNLNRFFKSKNTVNNGMFHVLTHICCWMGMTSLETILLKCSICHKQRSFWIFYTNSVIDLYGSFREFFSWIVKLNFIFFLLSFIISKKEKKRKQFWLIQSKNVRVVLQT